MSGERGGGSGGASRERWERLHELFAAASDLPEDERARYLDEACGGDADLRAEIERLLAAAPPSGFVEPPACAAASELYGASLEGRKLGNYELEREIGRGGMGVVYRARDLRLGRIVALKILPRLRGGDRALRERFLREARVTSQLDHPGIVGVLDSGESEGLLWYAMPLVRGHDLLVEIERQRRRRDHGSSEPLLLSPFGEPGYFSAVVNRFAVIAEALQQAHSSGIVHRDIKPQNLLLSEDGRLQLMDFGLVKVDGLETLTVTNAVQGTPYYMSPEQARAVRDPIDHRTDVYSLCVVLYELLSLRRPFDGGSVHEVLGRIASGTHIHLHKANGRIPRDLATICEFGMERRAADRYPSAGDLAADLRRFLHHESIVAQPPSVWRRTRNWCRRRPGAAAAVAVSLLAVAGASPLASWTEAKARRDHFGARIAKALDTEDWRGREELVADARRAATDARAANLDHGVLGERIDALDRRLRESDADRAGEVTELLKDGRGGFRAARFGPFLAPVSLRELFRGLFEAGRASAAYGDGSLVAELAAVEAVLPLLRVRLAPELDLDGATGPARVFALPLDPTTETFGSREDLGALPVEARLPPGAWRIVVEFPGVGIGEFDRELALDVRPVEIEAWIRHADDATAGMRLLPDVELSLESPPPLGCTPLGGRIAIAAFWCDEAEVSNREYLEFLERTGHEPPRIWRDVGYRGDWRELPGSDDKRWLDLPAVGMSAYDMRDYAEWRGARLPTHFELEYALRGARMSRTAAADERANVDRPRRRASGDAGRYREYVENALRVREEGFSQGPHALFHVRGNVAEMSSSPVVEVRAGRMVIDPDRHVYLGGTWDAQWNKEAPGKPAFPELVEHRTWGLDDIYAATEIGFRCVRSARPTRD